MDKQNFHPGSYDLISGKVNHVAYNPKNADQFFHRYFYDAENRLTTVETSHDSIVWERDARYEYYRHGPLARTVLGDGMVQGMDYAYTLQGWLKGVNSTSLLNASTDMGEDGKPGARSRYVARDVVGFALNYYTGDYSPVNHSYNPFPGHSGLMPTGAYRPLYNGNISSMAVNIAKLNQPLLYNYRYDQLNRLTAMDAYTGLNESSNSWVGSPLLSLADAYRERVSYDGNGNILKYLRQSATASIMDSLTYFYYGSTNRLRRITDNVPDASYGGDLDHQTAINNYLYDETGNLLSDAKEGITSVKWSVYGKILEITRTAGANSLATKISYSYDAAGNRTGKRVDKNTGVSDYTWYVRDAQGNVMSTYNTSGSTGIIPSTLKQTDVHLYGSSRLGVLTRNIDAKAAYSTPSFSTGNKGGKLFELTNHLGNVLTTISDIKKGVDVNSDGVVDYYLADIRTASDYYPFGMLMPGRHGYLAGTGSESGGASSDQPVSDLVVKKRSSDLPSTYKALNTIEFQVGFTSGEGDGFETILGGADPGSGSGGSGSGDWVDGSSGGVMYVNTLKSALMPMINIEMK